MFCFHIILTCGAWRMGQQYIFNGRTLSIMAVRLALSEPIDKNVLDIKIIRGRYDPITYTVQSL